MLRLLRVRRGVPRDRLGTVAIAVLLVATALPLLGATSDASAAHRPAVKRAAVKPPPVIPPWGITGTWNMVLNADFTDSTLDTQLWRPGWFGTGTTQAISQYEIDCYKSQNVVVAPDDTLDLNVTAKPSRCGGVRQPYTAAVVTTNPDDGRDGGGFEYRYGVAEARIYLPAYKGVVADWPQFVLLGQHWPSDGENDVMEDLSGKVCFHFHSPGHISGAKNNLGGCDAAIHPGWNTVATYWKPGSVTYYYNGVKTAEFTQGITSAPMYLVLADTVPDWWSKEAVADTMKVSFVRVWQPTGAKAVQAGYEYSF